MSRKHAWIALALCGICRTAAAQGFEVGGGIGRGCTGDSSGFCSGQTGPMWALHGGYWITDYVQIAVRFAALPLDDFTHSTPRDDRFDLADDAEARRLTRIDVTTRNRSRWLSGGEILYHFAGSRRFGFVLGAGIGELSNRMTLSCAPAGCERVLADLGLRVLVESLKVELGALELALQPDERRLVQDRAAGRQFLLQQFDLLAAGGDFGRFLRPQRLQLCGRRLPFAGQCRHLLQIDIPDSRIPREGFTNGRSRLTCDR